MLPNQLSSTGTDKRVREEAFATCQSYSQNYDVIATTNSSQSKLTPKVIIWKDLADPLQLSEDDSDSISESSVDHSCTGIGTGTGTIENNFPITLESYRFIKSLKESEHRPTTTRLTKRALDGDQLSFSSRVSSGFSSRNSISNPSSIESSRSNSTTFAISNFTNEIEQKLLRHAQLVSIPLNTSVPHIPLQSHESSMRDRILHTSHHQQRPSNTAQKRSSRSSSPQHSPLRTSGQLQFLQHSLNKPRPVHGSSRTSTNSLHLNRSGVRNDQVDSIEKLMYAPHTLYNP